MIQFTKPTNLNGAELVAELAAVGVTVNAQTSPLIDGAGNFWLDISESDQTKAAPIVAAHNGTVSAPDNSAAKAALLAKMGLTADEAKLLLS
jgi:hypothetical protein